MLSISDRPAVPEALVRAGAAPPPVFAYATTPRHYALPFPPVSFDPERWPSLHAQLAIACVPLGKRSPPAALLLAGTMLNAVYFQVASKGWQNFPFDPDAGGSYTFEPSMAFLGITLCIVSGGATRHTAAHRLPVESLDTCGLATII